MALQMDSVHQWVGRYGRIAYRYWATYRPQAVADLGGAEEQLAYFRRLDEEITDQVEALAGEIRNRLSPSMTSTASAAQATATAEETVLYDLVYSQPKEAGTGGREM